MSNNIFKPSGANFEVHGVSGEQLRVLRGREAFARKYCAEKGWDFDNLEWPQILEIRAQPGWKSPQDEPVIVRRTAEERGDAE